MLNLGNLQFTLGVNTRALDAARSRIEAFGNAVGATQRAANRGIDTAINQLRKQENILLKGLSTLNAVTRQIQNSNLTPQVKLDMIAQLNRQYNDLSKTIATTGKAVDNTKLDRAFAGYSSSVKDLQANLAGASRQAQTLAKTQAGLNSARQAEAAAAAQARYNQVLGITAGLANKSASESAKAFQAATSASTNAEKAWLRQENAIARNIEKARNLIATIEGSKLGDASKINLTDQIQGSIGSMRGGFSAGPLDAKGFSGVANSYTSDLGRIRREFQKAKTDMAPPATEGWRVFQQQLKGLGSTMLLVNGHLGGMSTRFLALSTIMGTYGVAAGVAAGATVGIGVGLTSVITKALQASMAIEKVEKALTAITGSSAVAGLEIDFVRDVSDQAGVAFTETAQAYARFSAASKSAGQTVAATHEQFRATALAAGTLSLGVEDTTGVFRALEQILSKGTVQAEELRGQLGDRFPGAFAIAAKAVGKTTRELGEMMKKGEVISREFVPAFIQALTQEYNIDVTKDIDTLQASLNRATTASTFFYNSFAENTNVVAAAKAVLEAFANSVNFLAENMQTIVYYAAGVAGALAGLTAAFVAVRVATLAWAAGTALVTWLGSVIGLLRIATSATQMWTVAQIALNTAMMSNPLGAVAAVVARLAVAIGAAYFGYKTFTGAVEASNASLNNTTGIRAYIEMQKKLGFQIRSTTNEFILQAKVAAEAQASQARGIAAEIRSELAQRKELLSVINNSGTGNTVKPASINAIDNRLASLTAQLNPLNTQLVESKKLLDDLVGLTNLPEQTASPIDAILGDSDKKKANIDALLDLIDSARLVREKMAAMSQGPKAIELVGDVEDARKMIRDFSTKELALADNALRQAGFSSGSLQERIAALMGGVRIAEEEISAFTSAWEALDEEMSQQKGLQKQIEFIKQGGSFDDLFKFENLAKAEETLSKMGKEGVDALRARLAAAGFEANTAAEALAKFWNAGEQGKLTLDYLEDARDMIKDIQDTILEKQVTITGIGAGFTNEDVGQTESLDQFVERTMLVNDYAAALSAAGVAGDEFAQAVANYNQMLLDSAGLENQIKKMEEIQEFRHIVAESMADAVTSFVTGSESILDVARNLVTNLAQIFTERFITEPLVDFFDKQLQSIGGDAFDPASILKGGGLGSAGLDSSASSSALALSSLASSAQSAAMALSQIGAQFGFTGDQLFGLSSSTQASTTALNKQVPALNDFGFGLSSVLSQLAGGGGGGGFFSSLLKIGTSVLGSTSFGGASSFDVGAALGPSVGGIGSGGSVAGWGNGLFAKGGLFRGLGGPKDDANMIRISDGEFIMQADAVRQWGVSTLEAMNSGRVPGYADGGLVGNRSPHASGGSGVHGGSEVMDRISFGDLHINVHGVQDKRAARTTARQIDSAIRERLARTSKEGF